MTKDEAVQLAKQYLQLHDIIDHEFYSASLRYNYLMQAGILQETDLPSRPCTVWSIAFAPVVQDTGSTVTGGDIIVYIDIITKKYSLFFSI